MKTKIALFTLVVLTSLLSSCTPNALPTDTKAQNNSPIYGTGGEHSAEPDNEKD